jgi:eukaryotic-like serine/threonine-protein kinase
MVKRMQCFDDLAFADFVSGRLSATALDTFESHIDSCASCQTLATALLGGEIDRVRELANGTLIGRHRVERLLGRGAMGAVYLAHDPVLDRKVALKVLFATSESSAEERVRGEAQAMARVEHPNVAAIYDIGKTGSTVFLAMEYVLGVTLRAWLTEQKRSWGEVCDVFAQAAAGLACAHAEGIVHRDFKPENVMVDPHPHARVRVLDFGLARTHFVAETAVSGIVATLLASRTRGLVGTPAYMAPEQLAGEVASAASDQFSFGVALYEALHGQRPFSGASIQALVDAARQGPPAMDPRLPSALASILRRTLAFEPGKRFSSMGALLLALQDLRTRKQRWILASGAAAMLGAVAVSAFVATRAPKHVDPCGGADNRSAVVWNQARGERVAKAFAPESAESGKRTVRSLDTYIETWHLAHRSVCEATVVRHEQSEALLDTRMHCLRTRLDDVDALASTLEQVKSTLEAAEGVAALRPVSECTELLTNTDARLPQERLALEAFERAVAEARAEAAVGRVLPALTKVDRLLAAPQLPSYRPIVAEAKLLRAMLLRKTDRSVESEKVAYEALVLAEAAHDDRTAARVWLEVLANMNERGSFLEVERLAGPAAAAMARLNESALLGASLNTFVGIAKTNTGKLEEAGKHLGDALAVRSKVLGAQHLDVSRTLTALGNHARARGQLDEALSFHQRALDIDQALLGSTHPVLARHYHNVAGILRVTDKYDQALVNYRHALELETNGYGARSHQAGLTHNSIALVYLGSQSPKEARLHLEVALDILGAHVDRAHPLVNLGVWAQGEGDRAAALRYFTEAHTLLQTSLGGDHERTLFVRSRISALQDMRPGAAAAVVRKIAPPPPNQLGAASSMSYGPAQAIDPE